MAPRAGWILRISANSPVARRVLRLGIQAVAGAAAMVTLAARKITGIWRRFFGTEHLAVVPAPAMPFSMRRLLVASFLSLSVMSAGISPCLVLVSAAPVSAHDCCPEKVEGAPTDASAPMVSSAPADCCIFAPAPLAPAPIPGTAASAVDRVVATVAGTVFHPPIQSSLHSRVIDPRARSAPRPSLVTVLLI